MELEGLAGVSHSVVRGHCNNNMLGSPNGSANITCTFSIQFTLGRIGRARNSHLQLLLRWMMAPTGPQMDRE